MDGNLSNETFAVDAEKLDAEIAELADLKRSVSEKNGTLRNRIKQILEVRGYHPKAMKMVRDIDAMSETERADFLRTFEPMFEAMAAHKWRAEAEDLLAGAEAA